jgi:hypothetical protein
MLIKTISIKQLLKKYKREISGMFFSLLDMPLVWYIIYNYFTILYFTFSIRMMMMNIHHTTFLFTSTTMSSRKFQDLKSIEA